MYLFAQLLHGILIKDDLLTTMLGVRVQPLATEAENENTRCFLDFIADKGTGIRLSLCQSDDPTQGFELGATNTMWGEAPLRK